MLTWRELPHLHQLASMLPGHSSSSFFFSISTVLAQRSAGIGVVEVQKLEVFAAFVVRTGPRELSRGSRACSRNRRVAGSIPPWSRVHFKATCAEQLAQSKLHRATCADQLAPTSLRRAPCQEQLAQSNLRRATCTEQLAQSSLRRATCRERNLHRATCRERNLQGPTCRSNLRGATCAEQLAQCNLRRGTCADQLAPTSLRRAPCLVLSRACVTNASCREKVRILQRWADLACDVLLSGQPWSSFGSILFAWLLGGVFDSCLSQKSNSNSAEV